MKKFFIVPLLSVCLVLGLMGGAMAAEIITQDVIDKKILTYVDFIKMADNFIILFDSASSMKADYHGTNKSQLQVAKEILRQRNRLLPDLGYNAGLYLYTPWQDVYPMQPYDRKAFGDAIERLPDEAKGPTLLQQGMSKLRGVLAGLSAAPHRPPAAADRRADPCSDPRAGLTPPASPRRPDLPA